jgi:hypothetical protein
VLTTLAIVISYLGWVGAQITALGLVFNVVSGGEISQVAGMWIGSMTILIYTIFGGMWAVASHRLPADDHHRAWHALDRWRDQRTGGRGRGGDRPCPGCREVRILACPRHEGNHRLCGGMDDHDVWVHSPAGRISARSIIQVGENCRMGLRAGRFTVLLLRLCADVPRLFGKH